MADRIYDADPDLRARAEAEREVYKEAERKTRANGLNDKVPLPDFYARAPPHGNGYEDVSLGEGDLDLAESRADLGEWDAGEDRDSIPPRGWLLGKTFCRRFLSSLVADGGVGKTAVRIAQLLALATGRPLTGERVFHRCRVLLVSLEDDRDELRRRARAAMLHHGIKNKHVKGWLFLAAPGFNGWKLATTENGEHKTSTLRTCLVEASNFRSCTSPTVGSNWRCTSGARWATRLSSTSKQPSVEKRPALASGPRL